MKTRALPAMMAFLLMSGSLAWAQQEETLGGVAYAIGDWPENGFGNHRAVVEVTAADAVRTRIQWRRHDAEFREKAVLVYDMATGAKIENVFACNITREYGDVVFQPRTVPGQYAVYYMPYQQPSTTSGSWNGSYLPPRLAAEPAWLAEHALDDSISQNIIRFSAPPPEGEAGNLGSSFEIIAGSAVAFAENNYSLTYEVRFADHRGPCAEPTLLLQSDGRGYRALVYDYGNQLVMGITRQDSQQSDSGEQLVKANWDAPWPVNIDRPLAVDWKALGLTPERVAITVPDIGSVQRPQATLDRTQPIAIEPGQGIVIGVGVR
ncbi:MAG: glycoside hydrolase domain-containing protein [Pirellulaceae bacterium]